MYQASTPETANERSFGAKRKTFCSVNEGAKLLNNPLKPVKSQGRRRKRSMVKMRELLKNAGRVVQMRLISTKHKRKDLQTLTIPI